MKLATLALVIEQPGHGMDVAKRFTARFGKVMRSGPSHIYAALKSLEEDGAVERPALGAGEDQQRVAYRLTRRNWASSFCSMRRKRSPRRTSSSSAGPACT